MDRRQLLAVGGLAAAGVAMGTPAAAASPADLTTDDLTTFRSLITAHLRTRADAVTRAGQQRWSADWSAGLTAGFSARLEPEVADLHTSREFTSEIHGGYDRATVDAVVLGAEVTASGARARVEERTAVHYSRREPGGPAAYEQRLEHDVALTRVAGRWRLDEVRHVPAGGLPPMTQRWVLPERSGPGGAVAHAPTRPDGSADQAKEAGGFALAGGYNYPAMANYAYNWALRRNSQFPNFDDHGGDCTSFVSQCMLAGGWQPVLGIRTIWAYWYAGNSVGGCTYTWGGAHPWAGFALDFSRRTYILASTGSIGIADVLQFDLDGSTSIDHTQICHRWTSTEKYMAQHGSDYRDRRLSEILGYVFRDNPRTKLYAHRT